LNGLPFGRDLLGRQYWFRKLPNTRECCHQILPTLSDAEEGLFCRPYYTHQLAIISHRRGHLDEKLKKNV